MLRSWAVPKGLPTSSRHDRLAVAVDDHAMDHLGYTDEHKSVADTGWWEEESRDDHRIVFVLHGQDGSRRYALIRTDRDWLLHLTKDQPPPDAPLPPSRATNRDPVVALRRWGSGAGEGADDVARRGPAELLRHPHRGLDERVEVDPGLDARRRAGPRRGPRWRGCRWRDFA